jgi:cysteine-rich repeat protein
MKYLKLGIGGGIFLAAMFGVVGCEHPMEPDPEWSDAAVASPPPDQGDDHLEPDGLGDPPSDVTADPAPDGGDGEPEPDPEADPEEDPEALLLKECGDGVIQFENGEQCDPGLNAGPHGDGCDNRCQVVPAYYCDGEPSICYSKCGDLMVANDELCDDGNFDDGDGCSGLCELEEGFDGFNGPSFFVPICGDGLVRGDEQCDDANNVSNDGCSTQCELQEGFDCPQEGFPCFPECGDGLVVGHETCDDLNLTDGDGCSSQCEAEAGYDCIAEPSTCRPDGHEWNICGDGVFDPAELNLLPFYCDDGNEVPGDGCNEGCQIEPDFTCSGAPSVCVGVSA